MSALPSRRDAEDIANGTTLSGNSELVERIYAMMVQMSEEITDALDTVDKVESEAYQRGYNEGQDTGHDEGYELAIEDAQGMLQKLAKDAPSSPD